jgi:hypothetical protein
MMHDGHANDAATAPAISERTIFMRYPLGGDPLPAWVRKVAAFLVQASLAGYDNLQRGYLFLKS